MKESSSAKQGAMLMHLLEEAYPSNGESLVNVKTVHDEIFTISSDIDSVDNKPKLKTCIVIEKFTMSNGEVSDVYLRVNDWKIPPPIEGIYEKKISSRIGLPAMNRYLVDIDESFIFNWLVENPNYTMTLHAINKEWANQGIDFELTIQKIR